MASYARVRAVQAAGLVKIYSPRGSSRQVWIPSYDPSRHQRSAATRAIRTMREIARSQRFEYFVTLTFASNVSPEEASREWGRLLRQGDPHSQLKYLRVTEWSPIGTNLHFHVLGNKAFVDCVEGEWRPGFYRSTPVEFSSLDRICFYMGKSFSDPGRPYKRRFVACRGSKPISQEFFTDDIERALEIARTVADTHSRYINEKVVDGSFGTYAEVSWDPWHFWE